MAGIYIFLAMTFVGVLLVLHSYFTRHNITTYEYCKDTWETVSGNPFRKYILHYIRSSGLKNFLKIFDHPIIITSNPKAPLKSRSRIDKT